MRKHKFLISSIALATAISPVVALASCNKKEETTKSIPQSMLNIQSGILLGLKDGASLDAYDTLVVPEDVTVIASEAFKDAFKEDTNGSTIKTIVFNSNLSFVGKNAFSGCDAITKLDLTKMKDIKIMGLKLGTDSFTTWKNSGGTAVLPDGITDMQKEWIKELFANAGLPGTWFGEEEKGDQEAVDKINAILEASGETFNTMSSMINYVKKVPEIGVDLETLTSTNPTNQYVWDSENQVVIQLNSANELVAGPKDYSLNSKKVNLWKMVKPSDSSKLLKSAKKNSNEVYADEFSSTTPYSQYLRTDYKETWEENKTLSFQSGLDTGNVEKLELTFTPADPADTPVINTMKSSLTINGSLDSVDHYGNLTELTVTSLGSGIYTEYGSVDAAIVVKEGNIVAEAGSQVNEIIVTTTDANAVKVTVAAGSDVGTVGATDENFAKTELGNIVTKDEGSEAKVETSKATDAPDPDPLADFYSGDGTENAPYTIKNKHQLLKFAEKVKAKASTDKLYFNLIADIDLEGADWTPVGTTANPFRGIFNGCGFTISNFVCDTTSATKKDNHVGFFGKVVGDVNTDYDLTDKTKSALARVWNSDDTLITENIQESKYTTVIKNLTIDKVTAVDANKYFVGGIAGAANHVYFGNCKVKSGTIKAWKHAGGIAGTMGGCVCQDCVVGDETNELTVTATQYAAGGITGSTGHSDAVDCWSCFAFVNCSTTKKVKIILEAAGGDVGGTPVCGSVGGLVGDNQSARCCIYDSCTNNADIEVTSKDTTYYIQYVAGIAAFGQNVQVIANCINNGNITMLNNSYVQMIGGITAGANPIIALNNKNTGAIKGYATTGMAGIVAGCHPNARITGSVNKGTLENTNPNPKYETAQDYFILQ